MIAVPMSFSVILRVLCETSAASALKRFFLLCVQLPDQPGPAVEDRHYRVGLLGRQLHDAARDALVLVTPQPVVIRRNAPYRYRHAREVTPGFRGHLAELRQEIGDVLILRPARMRDPAV